MKLWILLAPFYYGAMAMMDTTVLHHQLHLSIEERKVTVKMMQDRLQAVHRRTEKLQEVMKNISFPPEAFTDEIETLQHDKRSLIYIIACMKEDR